MLDAIAAQRSASDWLFGARVRESPGGIYRLRGYVMNATTIAEVADYLRVVGEQVVPGLGLSVEIRDPVRDVSFARAAVTERHPYGLRNIEVTLGRRVTLLVSDHGTTVSGSSAPVPGETEAIQEIIRLVERTSRPRIAWLPLLARTPWAVPVLALVLFATNALGDVTSPGLVALLIVTATLAAFASSAALVAKWGSRVPTSVVSPVRWKDVVAQRARTIIALVAALIGALATLLGVWLTSLLAS